VRASLLDRDQPANKEALVAHARAKLTVRGRELLVERVLDEGWSVAAASEAQGISRATAHKWLHRFEAEGRSGLIDRTSRPHRMPAKLSRSRERAILKRRSRTLEGPHRIGFALGESPSTVHRVLCRNGVPRLADIDRQTSTVVRYEREHPGELVHIDVKKQARIPNGGGWRVHGRGAGGNPNGKAGLGYDYLHIAVDDRTRIAYVEAHPNERDVTAAAFLRRAIEFYGSFGISIERVMTDNGPCYRSRAFNGVLAEDEIGHRWTRPYRPQTNGKVERFNLTLKWEWAYRMPYTNNDARLQALTGWVRWYNFHRPHMAHRGGTPISANNVPGKHS
jgi:transposase InsO family protein